LQHYFWISISKLQQHNSSNKYKRTRTSI